MTPNPITGPGQLKKKTYSPRQNDVISTKNISELISKNMSCQLQQINSPRINFISTFLSQQFWAGFGSGRARWVRASLVSALSSCPRLCCSEHASKSPQKSPKLDVNKKNAISKILNQKYLNKKIWPIFFRAEKCAINKFWTKKSAGAVRVRV